MRISKRRQQYLDKFKFPYHGQIFSSIKACCEYYDVAYSCVFPLKKEKNITAEKAIDHLRAAKRTLREISRSNISIYEGML